MASFHLRLTALAATIALPLTLAVMPGLARATELIMVEQPGCIWCQRWDEDIAPIWPKTAAGEHAPLRRAQLSKLPGDYELDRRVNLTPTFLIVDETGRELARLEGYPGEDFFWPLIEDLLTQATGFEPPQDSLRTQ